MIVGEVLYPDESHPRKKVECDCCGISYTNTQYKNLLDIYKLLYFNTFSTEVEYSYSILCHDCFLNNLHPSFSSAAAHFKHGLVKLP